MAKRRKSHSTKRKSHKRKAVTHKRKPATHHRKRTGIHGKKHRKWGHVSAHDRRVKGVSGTKRRKKRSTGMNIGKMVIPFAAGFLVSTLFKKKTA